MDKVTLSPNVSSISNKLNVNNVNKVKDKTAFGEMLSESIQDVNQAQKEADNMITKLASGESIDIHNTMIAVEKADISFQLMMQIRNKLVSAYQEIYRMQV